MLRGSLVVLGLAIARVAIAQPAPAPVPDTEKGEAKQLMQLGVKLLKSQDYLGALAVFKDAYARFPSAKILLNIGTTLKLLDRNAEAANTYQRYLDSSDADPARRDEVVAEIAELDTHVGQLAISAPPRAEIQVADEAWVSAATATKYRVAPGRYTLHARRTGDKPFEVSGDIAIGQVVPIAVDLVAIPKVAPTILRIHDASPEAPDEPRSRFALLLRSQFDFKGGAAAFVGVSADVTDRLQLHGAGILGHNFGGYVGASVALLTGTLRPIVCVGVPIFWNDGARVSGRAAGGLEIAANRHLAVIIELGVEHAFNPQTMIDIGGMPRTIVATSVIPAVAIAGRL